MANQIVITESDVNFMTILLQRYKLYPDNLNISYDELMDKNDCGTCTLHHFESDQLNKRLACWEKWIFIRPSTSKRSSTRNWKKLMALMAPLEQFLTLENKLEIMTPELKNILERIRIPYMRLSYIVNLLIKRHVEGECTNAISIAIKLNLKALELLSNFSGIHPFLIFEDFDEQLNMLMKNKCGGQIVLDVFKQFYGYSQIEKYCLKYIEHEKLKFILKNTRDSNSNMQFFLNPFIPGRLRTLDKYFEINEVNFPALVKYGGLSFYTDDDWRIMQTRGRPVRDDTSTDFEEIPRERFSTVELRCHQVILKYSSEREDRSFKRMCRNPNDPDQIHPDPEDDYVLKLLWSAIPDRFLLQEDFKSFLEHNNADYYNSENVMSAWLWYKDVVLNGANCLKSPRSLKHLSRCTIRQSMAMNFQLPRGVQSLKLPPVLINFILLKDCVKLYY